MQKCYYIILVQIDQTELVLIVQKIFNEKCLGCLVLLKNTKRISLIIIANIDLTTLIVTYPTPVPIDWTNALSSICLVHYNWVEMVETTLGTLKPDVAFALAKGRKNDWLLYDDYR